VKSPEPLPWGPKKTEEQNRDTEEKKGPLETTAPAKRERQVIVNKTKGGGGKPSTPINNHQMARFQRCRR